MTAPVALITGAAKRIGAETSRTLHAAGYSVAIHHRSSPDEANALAADLNAARDGSAHTFAGDLMAPGVPAQLVEAAVAHFGQLDVLVNNASTFYPTPLDGVTDAQFDDLIGTNLRVPLMMASAAAPYLRASDVPAGAAIVSIADIYYDRPVPGHVVYTAAKAGLVSVTQSLATELGPEVRVNAVAPGAILWHDALASPQAQAKMVDTVALKRRGEPADIAGAVLYLARDAKYVTGQLLKVDGGRSLHWASVG